MFLTLIRVLNKINLLKYLNLNGVLTLNKKNFKIPIIENMGYANLFMTEPWMIDLLKIILPIDDKTFVDVGVNTGQTMLKLRSVDADINYLGVEPNSNCVYYSNRLIEENNFKNTTILPVGISEENELGVLCFFHTSKTDSSASMITDFRANQKIERKEYIPLFNLESLKKEINHELISVLKIDVEGAELEVIKSFKQAIEKSKPIILIEILPVYDAGNGDRMERQNEIQNILFDLSYSIFRVKKTDDLLIDLDKIQDIGIHGDINGSEYIMVPDNKIDKFEKSFQQWLKIN